MDEFVNLSDYTTLSQSFCKDDFENHISSTPSEIIYLLKKTICSNAIWHIFTISLRHTGNGSTDLRIYTCTEEK